MPRIDWSKRNKKVWVIRELFEATKHITEKNKSKGVLKYIRMGFSEAEFQEDLDWVLSLFEGTQLTWEDKMHRWLYGRMMYATKAHKMFPKLNVFDCWRTGREMEKEVILYYQAYTMFLRKVQNDIKETYPS